jgi:small GTP-binding protein
MIVQNNPHSVRKILLLGPDKAGKTTIATTLCEGFRNTQYSPTIGVTFHTLFIDQKKILLWDCAGMKHFRTLWPLFLSGTHGIIYVVDGTQSFSIVEGLLWLEETLINHKIPILFLINKQDNTDAINPKKIKSILAKRGVQVAGTSMFLKTGFLKPIIHFLKTLDESQVLVNTIQTTSEGKASFEQHV